MVGKTLKSKNHGNFKIIENGSKFGYFKVKFLDTGNIDEFRKDAVKCGEIRDKFAVTRCGVGIIGNVKTRGKYKKYYRVWSGMIDRCYSGRNKAYLGKVTVCDEWKIFENFLKDCELIDGWDNESFFLGDLELDKDIKQRFIKHKVYSKETCTWIRKDVNSKIQDGQQKKFIAISPDGKKYCDSNITDFGRKHGLERRQISAVLHNRYKSTQGWTFTFK